MEFKGTIKWAGEVKSGISKKGSDWISQDIMVEEYAPKNPQYPQSLSATIKKADIIDKLKLEAVATISYNVKANKYNGKYYGTNEVWKIWYENAPSQPTQQSQPLQETTDSDLPF
jgi:hypothetical protein